MTGNDDLRGTEAVLRAALRAAADQVQPRGDGLQRIQSRTARARGRYRFVHWGQPATAAAVVAVVVAGSCAAAVSLAGPRQTVPASRSSSAAPTARPDPAVTPESVPAGPLPASPATHPVAARPDPVAVAPGLLALWPDRSRSEAAAATSAGTPADVATRFTTQFLGFTDDDLVLADRTVGDDATVTVGYRGDSGRPARAAVVHLHRWSGAGVGPWEVVGTDDTTLSLTTPGYGASVGAQVTLAGRITGVDESLTVAVLAAGVGTVAHSCCTAAGGLPWGPWTVTLTGVTAEAPVVVAVVSTGGHITAHERFAVTALRPAAQAGAPARVGVQRGRVVRLDGSGAVALTDGPADTNPIVDGDTVFFVHATSGCTAEIRAVPLTGSVNGATTLVSTVTGSVLGLDVAGGELAYTTRDCAGSGYALIAVRTGQAGSTGTVLQVRWTGAPPLPEGAPAVRPDGAVVLVVRTGMQAQVLTYAPGSTAFGDGAAACAVGPDALAEQVAQVGSQLVVAARTGTGVQLLRCSGGPQVTVPGGDATALSAAGTAILVDTGSGVFDVEGATAVRVPTPAGVTQVRE